MSAMMGSGDLRLISIMASAASLVGTATRTIRQSTSFNRAISSRVAVASRVSALVMDCTTMGAAPPTMTSPTRTGWHLRLGLMPSPEHVVEGYQRDEPEQDGQPDIMHHLLAHRIDRAAADALQEQEDQPPAIQRREGQDVDQPQAQAQEPDPESEGHRPTASLAGGDSCLTPGLVRTPRMYPGSRFTGVMVNATSCPCRLTCSWTG